MTDNTSDGKEYFGYKDAEALEYWYWRRGRPVSEIADRFGVSNKTIQNWMGKYGIETRSYSSSYYSLNRPELLQTWHHEHHLSLTEIGAIVGCSTQQVRNALERFDLKVWANVPHHRKLRDKEWLSEQYHDRCRTAESIADEVGCTKWTVRKWAKEYEITPGDSYPELRDEEILREWYWDENVGTPEMANRIGCSQAIVYRRLVELNIPTREIEFSGSEHPNFDGGSAQYGEGWTEETRQTVRERDGWCCQDCGMSQSKHREKYGKSLEVHHIIAAKEVDDPDRRNALGNLVTLCCQCHRKWEGIPGLRPDV